MLQFFFNYLNFLKYPVSADVQNPFKTPTKRKRVSETARDSPSKQRKYTFFEDPNKPDQVNKL